MPKLKIATGKSRFDKNWKNIEVEWDALLERISKTKVTSETQAQYFKLSHDKQDSIKDVGGFVGGHLKDGLRRSENVLYRSVISLDADFATVDFWAHVQKVFPNMAAIYSTHKHSLEVPRLRLLIPLTRDVSPDEYEAVSRKVAEQIGIDMFDDTTYQASRLMYWPSTSKDAEFQFDKKLGKWLNPDEVLATYPDWKDVSFWPQSSRVDEIHRKQADKQGDPLAKDNIIGAFCRTYSIQDAIETFLADVYEPSAREDRYTYIHGSTSGGLVIYNDRFAYSNHSTDPAGSQLCNAFDLVRIHKFHELDEEAKPDTPITRMPSYLEMMSFCDNDPKVRRLLGEEQLAQAKDDFGDIDADTSNLNATIDKKVQKSTSKTENDWLEKLDRKNGKVNCTIDNFVIILQNDPNLKNVGGTNEFNYRAEVFGRLPWNKAKRSRQMWSDEDDSGLRHYIEKIYGVEGKGKIDDALKIVHEDNRFHPVREYLETLDWDGKHRLNDLLVDYLGAENNIYVQTVTRKTIVAAVARIYEPGIKFDYMLTLTGPQGIGKSTLIRKLSKGHMTDSITTVGNKEAYEQLQGVWFVEMAELTATKKSDVEAVKQFVSKQEDTYRKAYGKHSVNYQRQCIFVGTTNDFEFLRDQTGNRRFWPVVTSLNSTKDVFSLSNHDVDQILAEAKFYYENGEQLYLNRNVEEFARSIQEEHTQQDPLEGRIEEYLETLLPSDWDSQNKAAHIEFFATDFPDAEIKDGIKRTKVCANEIWDECMQKGRIEMSKVDAMRINSILRRMPGWVSKSQRFGAYGLQRGFIRIQ